MKTPPKSDWLNTKWRPAMGWMYMVVCIFDFIIFPVLWTSAHIWQNHLAGSLQQWNPLTLQGAGLFHMAMGAVLGLAAWGRTKEKINESYSMQYASDEEEGEDTPRPRKRTKNSWTGA